MTRLRFIKYWGPYKPGDTHEPKNANTVHMLIDVYKLAVIEPDNPVATAEPDPFITDVTALKYLRKPQRNKMVAGPPKAKRFTED